MERYIEFPSSEGFLNTERMLEDIGLYYMVDRIDYAYDERMFLLRTKGSEDEFEFDELLSFLEDEFGRGDVRDIT
tara:strand:+ start:161 stop:385 length:225 start_codon:yes stop_codon:yes gene_type:complete